jgi:hypothetical protein
MTFDVRDRNAASLATPCDGVAVTKSVSRFACARTAYRHLPRAPRRSSEDDPGGSSYEALSITIDDGDGAS